MQLHTITTREPKPEPAYPLLAHGFRPFFLLASLYGAFFMSAWLTIFLGAVQIPTAFHPVVWHGHEMIFGFAGAAVCGFLLTATSTWSQIPPVTGGRLSLIVGVWFAGRIAMWLSGVLPAWAVAAVDLALFPALGWAIAPVLFSRGNRKNLLFLILLAAFFAANLLIHLEPVFRSAAQGLGLGVNLLVLLIVIIIGRIVPAFCNVARLGSGGPIASPSRPVIEALAIGSMALVFVSDLADPESPLGGYLAFLAAGIQAVRMLGWRAGKLLRKPYIWSLHLGYTWIIAGLVLKGVAALDGPVPAISALHALTAGGIGTMILAVMSIVGLLHTGRPAEIKPPVAVAFVLVSAAALARVLAPIIFYEDYREALMFAGALWAAAFLVYAAVYWPILTKPRPDGIPG
jgi:uncharacterized protein involved in response to NO